MINIHQCFIVLHQNRSCCIWFNFTVLPRVAYFKNLRSFSRISSSDIFFFLVLSRERTAEGPGAWLVLGGLLGAPSAGSVGAMMEAAAVGAEMGEVAASLVGGTERGSITERVYIWKMDKSSFIKCVNDWFTKTWMRQHWISKERHTSIHTPPMLSTLMCRRTRQARRAKPCIASRKSCDDTGTVSNRCWHAKLCF